MEFLELPTVWFLVFTIGAAAILAAGARLPAYGRIIAERAGIGETSIGLFGLAVITSLPELAVTISAMRLSAPDLALGNVLGSNNFNLTTAGVLSLLYGGGLFLRANLSRYARTGLLLIVSTALVGVGVVAGPRVAGLASILAFSLPIVVLFTVESRMGGGALEEELDLRVEQERRALMGAGAAFVALSLLVVVSGIGVSWAAKRIAAHEFALGAQSVVLGETFVGSLLVAVATSLPEVTVAFSAMHRTDSPDMALGTLMGSNSFNLLVFAVGAPFVAGGAAFGASAWSGLSGINMVNVIVAVTLTVMVIFALRIARTRVARRALALSMIPVYVAGLFVIYRA